MTKGDGAAVDVGLFEREGQLLDAVYVLWACQYRKSRHMFRGQGCAHHAGEGLVDLDEIAVVNGEAASLEDLRDGERGTDAHHTRRQASGGGGDVLGDDGEAKLVGLAAAHKKDGSGAVGELYGALNVHPVREHAPRTCEALPPVVAPLPHCGKADLTRPRASAVVP